MNSQIKNQIKEALETLQADCTMAISGEWDYAAYGTDGFKAMLDTINDALDLLENENEIQ